MANNNMEQRVEELLLAALEHPMTPEELEELTTRIARIRNLMQ